MRISDWSSDVCSSDLARRDRIDEQGATDRVPAEQSALRTFQNLNRGEIVLRRGADIGGEGNVREIARSEEHTSELQSLMRISYAVFCLKNKNTIHTLHFFYHTILPIHTYLNNYTLYP